MFAYLSSCLVAATFAPSALAQDPPAPVPPEPTAAPEPPPSASQPSAPPADPPAVPPPSPAPAPAAVAPPPPSPAPQPAPEPEPAERSVAPPIEEPPAFETSVNWGVGLRTEVLFNPSDADEKSTLGVGYLVRPYVIGQVHEYIKYEANLDSSGLLINDANGDVIGSLSGSSQNVRVLDAVLKFEVSDMFNLWVGHFLPPTDRANLSGPFFQNAWNYPVGQHLYPSQYAGRNDGVAYWGQVGEGAFKWQLGVFDLGTATDKPTLTARFTANLLEPESGYYNSSTYYGAKDVLAIGAVVHSIGDPDKSTPSEDSATVYSIDALFEKSLAGAGTLDLEGAFYGFGDLNQGNSFSVLASFLLAGKVGIGQLQPMVRWQQAIWDTDETFAGLGPDGSLATIDAAVQYIIDGHNARLVLNFQHVSSSVGNADAVTDNVITLGGQIQRF